MPIMRNYRGSQGGSQASSAKTLLLISLALLLFFSQIVRADDCEDIDDADDKIECYSNEISEASKKRDDLSSKIEQYKKDLSATEAELNEIQAAINSVRAALVSINNNLEIRRESLGDKLALRDSIVREQYQAGRLTDLEFFLLVASNLNGFRYSTLVYIFDKSLADEALQTIEKLNYEISNFENDKLAAEKLQADLEIDQQSLVTLKAQIDATRAQTEQEVASIEKEIAELSSKQQAIIAAKSGDFSASLSEGVETDDSRTSINYNPGFSPAFAAFSYGAYTHRNGMSQYGARGRAEDGQDYKQILKFYYKADVDDKDDLDDKKICVQGVGEKKIGTYLKGLGEMPPSWDEEALKAQAVAARTYAYNYTKNGNCICTTTSCQYYNESLEDRSDRERWYDAIEATENKILEGNVSAQYSSTTGGWINNVGWDRDGSWPNGAYEKKGGSPWFYKAWFTQTYKKDSSTCGFKDPWLDDEEMADILNAYVLLKAGKNTERVIPETIEKCPIGGFGGDPYSKSELRNKAEDADKGFSSVSGVNTPTNFGEGRTSNITFQTDKGSYQVDGQLFAKAFNLRAPGYIAIKHTPDSKALYEIVKK